MYNLQLEIQFYIIGKAAPIVSLLKNNTKYLAF